MARIVMVQEDPDIVEMLVEVLEEDGHDVVHLLPAACTVDLVAAANPDLILLEARLDQPHPGTQLLEALRHDPRTASIPLIVCSTDVQHLLSLYPRLQGRDVSVVAMPFDLQALEQLVAQALEPEGAG